MWASILASFAGGLGEDKAQIDSEKLLTVNDQKTNWSLIIGSFVLLSLIIFLIYKFKK